MVSGVNILVCMVCGYCSCCCFGFLSALHHVYMASVEERFNIKHVVGSTTVISEAYSEIVYKDRPRDQQNVVFIHRWSLYAGSVAWKVYT